MNLAEQIKQLAEEQKNLLKMIAAILIFLTAYKFIAAPILAEADANDKVLLTERQKIEAYKKFAADNKKYKAVEQQYKQNLTQARQKLPQSIDLTEITQRWQRAAAVNGVKITALKVPFNEDVKQSDKLKKYPFNMNISGDYFAVIKFLKYLETDENFVEVTNMNIRGDERSGAIQCSMTANVYTVFYVLTKSTKN